MWSYENPNDRCVYCQFVSYRFYTDLEGFNPEGEAQRIKELNSDKEV